MKIILSPTCKQLSGSFGRNFGYFVVQRKNGFFSVRSKHSIPPDGHWRFILSCARLSRIGLHMSEVQIPANELYEALYEARHFVAAEQVRLNYANRKKSHYNAVDIINLVTSFGL